MELAKSFGSRLRDVRDFKIQRRDGNENDA